MERIEVAVTPAPYEVLVDRGLLDALPSLPLARELLKGRKTALVSDSTVYRLHGEKARAALEGAGADMAASVVLKPGEENKNLEAVSSIWEGLVKAGMERTSLVVAFGGGVVGDLAGFAAATYLRGVDFVQIPTTVLAMVDSSVGGKTGFDLPSGKNLIGAFHQPKAVFADLALLSTLPQREGLSGLAEAIKAGILKDERLFSLFEEKGLAIMEDREALLLAVASSVRIKAGIVAADEREGGARALLNLGHTLGHAVEAASDFKGPAHGEAVGLGMRFAARLSVHLGLMGAEELSRIESVLDRFGYPATLGGLPVSEVRKAFQFDKKNSGGRTRWVVPEAIGRARWGVAVDDDTIDLLLDKMQG